MKRIHARDHAGTIPPDWEITSIAPIAADQKHAAQLYVCSVATDASDARLLLDMLGLVSA